MRISGLILLGLMLLPARASAQEGAVLEIAEAYLQAAYPEDVERLEVRVLRLSNDLAAADAAQVAFPAAGEVPEAHTQVDVLAANGEKLGWALLYVAHFDSVVVSRARLTKDTEILSSDLTVSWMETTKFHGIPLTARDLRAIHQQGPLFASRLIQEGQALRASDVRPAYAADTGGAVMMSYSRGPISLRLSCKAREPGALGETVRLYAPDTETTYRARLTAPGQAEWVETL